MSKGEWQPIETAPKDGTMIIVAHEKAPQFAMVMAYWRENLNVRRKGRHDLHKWVFGGRKGAQLHWSPTHWMPLPEPPA